MAKKLFTSLLCPSMKVTEDQLETDVNLLNMERSILAMNRRNFMGALAAAGATAATMGVAGFATKAAAQTVSTSVLDVLNFALNLEYLEANLYLAVTGQPPLSSSLTLGGPTPTSLPTTIALDTQSMQTAVGLAANEVAHIQVLQNAITANGGTPVAQPSIDYSANNTVTITTKAQFLSVARQFTAVGNSAYAGAAQFLIGTPALLTAAAQILGAEGQHLGAVGYLCDMFGVVSPMVDPADYPPVPTNTSYFTISPPNTAANLGTGAGPALGPTRTFSEVLGIVYGVSTATAVAAQGTTKGGFFPSGVSGVLAST